jgi:AcrR family transcriptional regulator
VRLIADEEGDVTEPKSGAAALPPGLQRLWGLDRGPRPGQRPSLDVRTVATTAAAIADERGLDGVSMSRVASELGVTTMALYRYVDSKDELLEVMLEVAVGDPPPLDPELDWQEGLRAWATSLRQIYRDHPWSLDVPVSAIPRGPHQLAWLEQGLAALRQAGLEPGERIAAVMLVMVYVRGQATLERQAAPDVTAAGAASDFGALLREVLDPERYPELAEMAHEDIWDEPESPDEGMEDEYAFGLERVLDGLELHVRRRRR